MKLVRSSFPGVLLALVVACGGADDRPPTRAVAVAASVPPEVAPAPSSSSPAPSQASSAAPVIADADGDGVADARDVCPREKGAGDQNPAWAGCPYDAPPRPSPNLAPPRAVLDFGAQPRKLDEAERAQLNDLAARLAKQEEVTLLTASSSAANAAAWNRLLTSYLVAGGVDTQRLVTRACVAPKRATESVIQAGNLTCTAYESGQ